MTQLVKITTYGCKEYLCRIGMLDGTLEIKPLWPRVVTIADVKRVVANQFRIPLSEMTSARRSREVARPRQASMYLAKKMTPRSLPEIGRRHGNRDHTTVIHAINQIEKLMATDLDLRRDVLAAERAIEELRG